MTEESKRERKRFKTRTKTDGKSGTAEDCAKPIPKIESTGSPSVQRVEPSSSDPSARAKASKKRKRSEHDVVLDESETNAVEPEPRTHRKHHTEIRGKDQMCHQCYPDPADDESLSEQSRKALTYAYERWRGIEAWKFNKARQNWLLRNVWSEQAIPESYVGLVIEYLAGIKGGVRENLVEECISKTSTSEKAPIQSAEIPEDGSEDRSEIANKSTINEQLGASRARSLLQALRKTGI